MEARVGVSSTPERGLVEEARNMAADYLIIGGGQGNRSNRSGSHSFMQKLWTKISFNYILIPFHQLEPNLASPTTAARMFLKAVH